MSSTESLCIACRQPIHSEATRCHHCQTEQKSQPKQHWQEILKWLGSITVIISVITGLYQINTLFEKHQIIEQGIKEWVAAGQLQAKEKDFDNAWKSFKEASKLTPGNPYTREAQVIVGMQWLQDNKADQNILKKNISDIESILYRGLVAECVTNQQKADIYAHLAWIKINKNGNKPQDQNAIKQTLQNALNLDETNLYANSFKGYWLSLNYMNVPEIEDVFAKALQDKRDKHLTYRLYFASLNNLTNSLEAQAKMIGLLPDIERQGLWKTIITERLSSKLFSLYGSRIHSDKAMQTLLSSLPIETHRQAFKLLRKNTISESYSLPMHNYVTARIEEAAGEKQRALDSYKALATTTPPGTLLNMLNMGIKRLSNQAD